MFNSQFSIPIRDEVQTLGGFPGMRIGNWELGIGQIRSLSVMIYFTYYCYSTIDRRHNLPQAEVHLDLEGHINGFAVFHSGFECPLFESLSRLFSQAIVQCSKDIVYRE